MYDVRVGRVLLAVLGAGLALAACDDPDAATAPGSTEMSPSEQIPAELEATIQHLQQTAANPAQPPPPPPNLTVLGDRLFVAALDGNEEVPPVGTRASGFFALLLDHPFPGFATFVLTHNVRHATMAHIHRGAPGVNGMVVVNLDHTRSLTVGQAFFAPLVAELKRGHLYVNVHSRAHPGGEIRGQLLRLGEILFTTTMSGGQEVPPNASRGTGHIAVVLHATENSIRYEGSFAGLTAVTSDAHLHAGIPGVNGAVRVPLTIPLGVTSGAFSGTAPLTAETLGELLTGGIYANIHSTAFPGGEIRGQLQRK